MQSHADRMMSKVTNLLCRLGFHKWTKWKWGRQNGWHYSRQCERNCGIHQRKTWLDLRGEKFDKFEKGHSLIEAIDDSSDD